MRPASVEYEAAAESLYESMIARQSDNYTEALDMTNDATPVERQMLIVTDCVQLANAS